MTNIDNPRFPHRIKVFRYRKDQGGEVVKDSMGNPKPPELVFESQCGYRDQNRAKTSGEVWESDYKVSVPHHKTVLVPGDTVEMTDYNHTFQGELVKSMVYNMGANIWFNEIGN